MLQIVVVERVRELRVPICEGPRTAEGSCLADAAHEMNHRILAARVVRVAAMNREQHDRTRAEVEWNVVAEHPAAARRHLPAEPAILDVRVPEVRRDELACDSLRVGPLTALVENPGEVLDVGDVEDQRVLRRRGHSKVERSESRRTRRRVFSAEITGERYASARR